MRAKGPRFLSHWDAGRGQRSEAPLAVAEDTLDYEHAVFGNSRRVSRPKATSPTLTY